MKNLIGEKKKMQYQGAKIQNFVGTGSPSSYGRSAGAGWEGFIWWWRKIGILNGATGSIFAGKIRSFNLNAGFVLLYNLHGAFPTPITRPPIPYKKKKNWTYFVTIFRQQNTKKKLKKSNVTTFLGRNETLLKKIKVKKKNVLLKYVWFCKRIMLWIF